MASSISFKLAANALKLCHCYSYQWYRNISRLMTTTLAVRPFRAHSTVTSYHFIATIPANVRKVGVYIYTNDYGSKIGQASATSNNDFPILIFLSSFPFCSGHIDSRIVNLPSLDKLSSTSTYVHSIAKRKHEITVTGELSLTELLIDFKYRHREFSIRLRGSSGGTEVFTRKLATRENTNHKF